MPLIHAEFADLSAFEDLAKQTEQRFRQTLADLEPRPEPDGGPVVRGRAGTPMQWCGPDWFAAATEIHAAIAGLHRHLATARANYQRAVAANVSIWKH